MFNAPSMIRTPVGIVSCALALLLASAAPAQSIDVSLNVHYADPENIDSGGTWEIVAKSSHVGIATLEVRLTNIETTPAPLNQAPRGNVNGTDPAGFRGFDIFPDTGFTKIFVYQEPTFPSPGEEQGIFYGVGTLQNGAPNYPGKPPGTLSIGPAFTSLTNVQDVPWAAAGDVFGDAAWNSAATLISGTFDIEVTPGFHTGMTGNIFTTLGTSMSVGTVAEAALTTIVRTNFSGELGLPDYNSNGVVDAADYVLWRKGSPLADGNGDSIVNQLDFDLWRANFGAIVVPGGGAGSRGAIPEPASGALLSLAAILIGFARRARR